jgi:dolichol-phosphate mannosyltransferase
MYLSVVLPLYNEVESVPRICRELLPIVGELAQSHTVEVVFVDDGSTDGTGQALRNTFLGISGPQLRFCIERHPKNQGLGAALRTGFVSASGEVIVTTDSDGSYEFTEIPALVSHVIPGIDIVTASPYHPEGKVVRVPACRTILSRGASLIYRLLVDWRIRTYTCLFRAYRREVIENVSFECNGYQAVTEILVKGMLLGYRVAEYPAILHKRALGASKVKLVRTIMDHLRFLALVLLHRMGLKPLVRQDQDRRGQQQA